MLSKYRAVLVAGLVMMLVSSSGCGYKYKQAIHEITEPYQIGQFDRAGQQASKVATEAESRDKLVLLLEEGCVLRAAGRFAESNKALDHAEELFGRYDRGVKGARIDREALSALTSPAALTYEGYGYDRIMMNVYKALNSLEAGQAADARAEILRIGDSQKRCEERYRDRIAQSRKEQAAASREARQNIDVDRVRKDQLLQRDQQAVLADFPEVEGEAPLDDLRHQALYSNPFAEYLQGVFFLYSEAAGETEIGRVAFRNAAGMAPQNTAAARDAKFADDKAKGGAVPPRTYVFFETGMAPHRVEIKIRIPVFIYNATVRDTKVDYIAIAFPKLKKMEGGWDRSLNVITAEGTVHTEMLGDMDAIVAREFKNEMPLIITRAIIGAFTKAAIQYGIASGLKKSDENAQILGRGIATIFNEALSEADTRTWRTLPKQIQVVSCVTPEDGKINFNFGGGASQGATVKAGKANIVWVRRPSTSAPPRIRTFTVN